MEKTKGRIVPRPEKVGTKSARSVYNVDIERYELLSEEETIGLVEVRDNPSSTEEDRDNAIDKLVVHNLKLVRCLANDFSNCGLQQTDIIQVGNIALMYVMREKKFDPRRGRLSVYLRFWMNKFIKDEVSKFHPSNVMTINTSVTAKSRNVDAFIQEFQSKKARKPTSEEIASKFDIGVRHARTLEFVVDYRRVEIDADTVPVSDDWNPDPVMDEKADLEIMKKAVKRLSPINRDVIEGRFGIGRERQSLKELGEKYSKTPERIRQIQSVSIAELRNMIEQMRESGVQDEESDRKIVQ